MNFLFKKGISSRDLEFYIGLTLGSRRTDYQHCLTVVATNLGTYFHLWFYLFVQACVKLVGTTLNIFSPP